MPGYPFAPWKFFALPSRTAASKSIMSANPPCASLSISASCCRSISSSFSSGTNSSAAASALREARSAVPSRTESKNLLRESNFIMPINMI